MSSGPATYQEVTLIEVGLTWLDLGGYLDHNADTGILKGILPLRDWAFHKNWRIFVVPRLLLALSWLLFLNKFMIYLQHFSDIIGFSCYQECFVTLKMY